MIGPPIASAETGTHVEWLASILFVGIPLVLIGTLIAILIAANRGGRIRPDLPLRATRQAPSFVATPVRVSDHRGFASR